MKVFRFIIGGMFVLSILIARKFHKEAQLEMEAFEQSCNNFRNSLQEIDHKAKLFGIDLAQIEAESQNELRNKPDYQRLDSLLRKEV